MRMPDAVLWDMDGTIVDTEPFWMAAETRLVESFGGQWGPEQGLTLVGRGLEDAAGVLQQAGVQLDIADIVDTLTDEVTRMLHAHTPPLRAGVLELLASLRESGVPTGLVTMSLRRMAHAVVEALQPHIFDVIVSGDSARQPKPHPDPYLQAAEALGADITRCVVIEDSPGGVRAGVSAGAVTIGVPHLLALDGLGAHALWPTLAGRDARAFAELLHSATVAGVKQ